MPGKKLFLIDGSAIAYRSYFAFINNPLINSKGQNTSAVFGFLRFLYMIYDNEQPDYLAVVFDPRGKTVRHSLFADYKATRQKMPDDMRDQIPQIHETLAAMNVPMIEIEGYEADDVIGTLAKRAQADGFDTFLVSGDKDFMQLVDQNIKMYNPKRAGEAVEVLDVAGVEEKVGLPPAQIVDYLALMGDTSDNVPGVRGVGEKTAVSLIQEYGDVESVLANAEKVSRKNVRENLQAYREDALLSKKLVTIDTRVPVEVDLSSLSRREPDNEKLTELFRNFEFTSLLERVEGSGKTRNAEYIQVETREQLERLLAALEKARMIVVDLETTGPDPMRADIIGMSFSIRALEAYYLPLKIEKHDGSIDLCLRKDNDLFGGFSVTNLLRPILEDNTKRKAGHNIKYDMLVLRRHGIRLQGISFDTMIASYLINPTFRQHNLDALALEHLNYKKISTKELLGTGKKQRTMAEVEKDKILRYACEDADITFKLTEIFAPQLRANNLQDLFEQVERPLIDVLAEMEQAGVSLDLSFLSRMSEDMSKQLELLVAQIYEMAGEEFNINSTQQLGEILFEKLNLPRKKKTKTGYSTDANVLEELAKIHELPRTLLEYRELTKLKSTYVDALPSLVNPETGRLHTSYNQTVAATGRLSSSDPNLQNIPIRTDTGREIRRAFIPCDENHVILDADYSQIELRVMAHLSGDPVLLESFRNEEDIHAKTASLVFNIAPDEVNTEHRRRAKEINFGIMYGMGVFGLASRLKISNEEARAFIDSYFIQYQKVHEFIYLMHRQVEERGFVKTLLNRRRYLPEINSKNYNIREFAKRTAVNTPIQGTAAELIKVAMINIWRRLQGEKLGSKMIMQVHDELVFEVPRSEIDYMKELVRTEMEGAMPLAVPIKADVGVGPNWLEAH
jgi:DNA polymerase-1